MLNHHACSLAVDAMGGDHGVKSTVPAVLRALRHNPHLQITLVGDQTALERAVRHSRLSGRLQIQHAAQVVGMDESPIHALRRKRNSSMWRCLELVRDGQAQAVVSAGNTGALLAMSRFVLKTLPGIDRPAFVAPIPGPHRATYMLDLGANPVCTPENLMQFALMGSVLVEAVEERQRPRVALLNVGEEQMKGNQLVQEASKLIEASNLNYTGFVEGDQIFADATDVIVCDGFVGNITLKTIEGSVRFVADRLQAVLQANVLTRLASVPSLPLMGRLRSQMDPRRYNGATFIGLPSVVVKSHGGADAFAFERALLLAQRQVQENVPGRVAERLAQL